MQKKLHVLVILLFLGACPISYAQVKDIGLPKVINYKKADYSGGSQNWDIGQDKAGNLYFANTAGLLEFDGTSWSRNVMPYGTVRSLKVTESGRVYVGGYNEFGYFEANANGKLVYYSLSKLIPKTSTKIIDFVWKIHRINGVVYFQTFFCTYIYKEGKLSMLDAPNRFKFSFAVNNTLYFQDINLGLMEYSNGKLVPMPGTQVLNSTEIWGVLPFGDGRLMIITNDRGIFTYHDKTLSPWECEANDFIKKNNALGGRVFDKNSIMFNSVQDGIILCDTQGKIIQHISTVNGLQNNTALSTFIDRGHNLWAGLDNGISFINENSPFTYLGSSFGFSSVYASVVHDGYLYVATNQGLFRHTWKEPFKEESFKLVEGTTGQAWDIQSIDGDLFCSHNHGLFLIAKGKAIKILDDTKGYMGLKKIPGRPGFLIACNYLGFSIIEKTPSGYKFRNQVEGFTLSDSKFATDGTNVWLRKNDVFKLKLSDDLRRFATSTTYKQLDKGLNGITSIQNLGNKIYFQTDNRFYTYNNDKDAFIEDKAMTGVFSALPKMRYCFEDQRGNICYFVGISEMGMLIKEGAGKYRNVYAPFSVLTGNLVYFFESVNTINSSTTFIGITEGLVHYNPQLQTNTTTRPKAFISTFIVANDTLYADKLHTVKEVNIPFKNNSVKFTFSSPLYDNPDKIKFSYKLDGFDNQWSNWSTVSGKEYTYLQEGTYTMQVRVMDSYGSISGVAGVSFIVAPPFYRHPLAYAAYAILIIGGIYYSRRRFKTKIRQNRYLEALEQQKLFLEKETMIRQEQFELEKEIERLKNEQLQDKILKQDKELVNNSLQVVKKDKILNSISTRLKDIDPEKNDESTKVKLTKLSKTIDKELTADKSHNSLEKHIRNVHFDFLKRLKEKYPAISPREMDLATYLLMNMSTKEIAEMLNISDGGTELARHRLRKKLGLSRKENLISFLMSI